MISGYGGGGFGGLTDPRPTRGPIGPVGARPINTGIGPAPSPQPGPMPVMSGAPADLTVPTPGAAPAQSPLGMWQSWLQKMGPYLAQKPTSEPMAESGGLSSLVPSQVGPPGALSGYGELPRFNRGFRDINFL